MRGKAHREPARHSVVLDCKLVPLHNTCQSLPAVCYITSIRLDWQCSPMRKFRGWAKTRQPFSAVSATKGSPNLAVCRESLQIDRFLTYTQIYIAPKSWKTNRRRWRRVTRQWKQTGRSVTLVDAWTLRVCLWSEYVEVESSRLTVRKQKQNVRRSDL